MSALSIQPTFPIFTDIDGQPLENGYIWIGTANLDPQTNPINVYWDAALTIQATQPIRTLAGYPSRSGTPARLYVNSNYSIRVQNRNGSMVYSAPEATERYSDVVLSINAEDVVYDPPFTGGVATNVEKVLSQVVRVTDFGAFNDGTNAAATQAAFVAALAASNSVYVPPGTYLVNGNINIQNKTLFGDSWRNTTIQLTGSNTNTPVFINSATAASSWGSGGGFTLNNLTVTGNWDGSTANPVGINFFDELGSIVKWHAGSYVNVSNSRISGSFAHALAFDRLGYSYFQFNEITTNKYDGIHLNGPSGTESVTSTWVSNNSIHSCRGTACIYLKNGLTMQATQNVLEDATHGFYVDGNDNRAVAFCFNDMEQMSGSGVNIQGSGQAFNVSNNFLGVTTPLTIANSREFRNGIFTNNAFSSDDYVTFMPTIGSGTTSGTAMNFFGQAIDGSVTGQIGWRSNNNFGTDPEVQILGTHYGNANQRGGRFLIRTADPATNVLSDQVGVSELGVLYPARDNVQTLGAAANRWSVVYAGTGTINTSDEAAKQDIRALLDAEKSAAVEMKGLLKAYRFKDAVAAKGNAARIHFGAVAQDVAAVFAKHGLDANQYGIFCSDTWYEYNGVQVEVDANKKYITTHQELDGVVVTSGMDGKMPEGSIEVTNKFDTVECTRLGLRYDELFAFIIAAI